MHIHEFYNRSVAKTVTYRIAIMTTSYVVLLIMTGNNDLALEFSGISLIYSTILYYVHERVWARVDWGVE